MGLQQKFTHDLGKEHPTSSSDAGASVRSSFKEPNDGESDKALMAVGSPRIEKPPSVRPQSLWAANKAKIRGVGMSRAMAHDMQRKHGHLSAKGIVMPPPMPRSETRSYEDWALMGGGARSPAQLTPTSLMSSGGRKRDGATVHV